MYDSFGFSKRQLDEIRTWVSRRSRTQLLTDSITLGQANLEHHFSEAAETPVAIQWPSELLHALFDKSPAYKSVTNG